MLGPRFRPRDGTWLSRAPVWICERGDDSDRADHARLKQGGGQHLRIRPVTLVSWPSYMFARKFDAEVPAKHILREHHGGGVEVVAISVDTADRKSIEKWIDERGLLYPVAFGNPDLAQAYDTVGLPYHLLLGPDGSILERLNPGYHDDHELNELLARHSS